MDACTYAVTVRVQDESYSYLLGAYLNAPQFGAEPERFGAWDYAQSVVFYPSIVDTEGDTCRGARDASHRNSASPCVESSPADTRAIRLKHFVAYVKGAATRQQPQPQPQPQQQQQGGGDERVRGARVEAVQATRVEGGE